MKKHISMMMFIASGAMMLAPLLIVDAASTVECIKDSHTVSLITQLSFFKDNFNPSPPTYEMVKLPL
jgi:hypothetical protein